MATMLAEAPDLMLTERTADGRARSAAIEAARKVAARPTSAVSYRSTGALLVIGPEAEAVVAARRLHPRLRCTVVVHEDAPEKGRGGVRTRGETAPAPEFPVLYEKVVQLTGHLGQYAVVVSAPPPLGGVNLLQKLGSQRTHFDLVLDLTDPPFLRHELLPVGYYAPRGDAAVLERALAELPEMVGEFEKPRFYSYNPDICAHGAAGLTGCTRCIDACPASAIVSVGEDVAVDPYLCQGAGVCASVCPTGAMTYRYPSVADQLDRLAALIKTYRAAGGARPLILLHDAETGRTHAAALADRLPERVIPFELAELGSLGMEAWLAALAYGAEALRLLPTAATPPGVRAVVAEQCAYAGAILDGMGYSAALVALLEGDDAAVIAALRSEVAKPDIPPAAFAGVDEKRTLLRLGIEHLYAHAPARREVVALPEGAPFGEIRVDRAACTLCMACVGVCPASALLDGGDLPQLNFIEGNCVQCGLCERACPEDAIGLTPRYLYDPEGRRATRVLNEETPFHCVACGKPFATRKMMDRMTAKLQGHWMYQAPEALRRIQMCGDCRVRDVFRAEAKRPGGL